MGQFQFFLIPFSRTFGWLKNSRQEATMAREITENFLLSMVSFIIEAIGETFVLNYYNLWVVKNKNVQIS